MKLNLQKMGIKTKVVLYCPATKLLLGKHGEYTEDLDKAVNFGIFKNFVKWYWERHGTTLEYKSFMIYKKGFMGLV